MHLLSQRKQEKFSSKIEKALNIKELMQEELKKLEARKVKKAEESKRVQKMKQPFSKLIPRQDIVFLVSFCYLQEREASWAWNIQPSIFFYSTVSSRDNLRKVRSVPNFKKAAARAIGENRDDMRIETEENSMVNQSSIFESSSIRSEPKGFVELDKMYGRSRYNMFQMHPVPHDSRFETLPNISSAKYVRRW